MYSNFHVKNYWREDCDPLIPTERYVKYIYQRKGFAVQKLYSKSKNTDVTRIVPVFLVNYVKYTLGIPDFLVIDKKTESFFFLEVKLSSDGLSRVQAKWINDHPHLCTVVLYVHDNWHSRGREKEAREERKYFTFSVNDATSKKYILESIVQSPSPVM